MQLLARDCCLSLCCDDAIDTASERMRLTVFARVQPNARLHLLPEAGATQERTLSPFGSRPWFGWLAG